MTIDRERFEEFSSLLDTDDQAEVEDALAKINRAIPQPPSLLRVAVALLAIAQLPIVLGWFLNRDVFGLLGDMPTEAHLVRDGALGLVIVASAGLTAWRPRWAVPSFAIASVALVAQLVGGFADDTISSSPGNETVHLLLLVLTLLIGACGMRLRPLVPGSRAAPLGIADPPPAPDDMP